MATRGKPASDDAPEHESEADDGDQSEWGVRLAQSGEVADLPTDRVARMLLAASGQKDSKVRVYRRVGEGGRLAKMSWCKNYSVGEFEGGGDLEMVRREWGPGPYHLRVYNARGGVVSMADVDIEAPFVTQASTAPVQQGTDLAQLAGILQEGQRQVLDAVTRATARDPMESMSQMLTMAKLMREAFGATPAPAPPAPKTLLEQMAELRALREVAVELAPPSPDAEDDMGKLMSLGGQVVGMVKDAMQRPEPAPVGLAPVTLPPTLAFAPRPLAQHPPPEPSRWPPLSDDASAPSTTATQQENPVPQVATEPNPANHLQTLLAQAVVMAQAGMHPELGAQLLIGSDDRPGLPDEMIDMIERDDWWTVLTSVPELSAALAPYEAWVRQVRTIMIGWLAEDDAADGEESDAETPSAQQQASA